VGSTVPFRPTEPLSVSHGWEGGTVAMIHESGDLSGADASNPFAEKE